MSQNAAAQPRPNIPVSIPAGNAAAKELRPQTPPQPTPVAAKTTADAAAQIPTRLSALRVLTTVACLLFGALTAGQLVLSYQANRAAAADTQQLIRVQNLKANLLRADALATNAFLVGGLEPANQRAAYDAALEATTKDIAAAADAQPADEAALSELNVAVQSYASSMEQARANNRQGFPVGSAYLSQASNDLRTRALPIMDALVAANSGRAESAMGNQRPAWILVPGVLALVVLVAANQWIASRFKRRINVGLAVAAGAILAMTAMASLASASQLRENESLKSGAYERVVDGSQVRAAANDAKAYESLRLIARGSGATFEKSWASSAQSVTDLTGKAQLSTELNAWNRYAEGHAEVVRLDDNGEWDRAVALATSPAADAPSAAFADFDEKVRAVVDGSGSVATKTLGGMNLTFLFLAVGSALAGLGAAAAAWRGVSRRLEEYS